MSHLCQSWYVYKINIFHNYFFQSDSKKQYIYDIFTGNQPLAFAIPIDDFNDKFLVGCGNVLGAVTWDEKSSNISNFKKIEVINENAPNNRINVGKVSPNGILFVGNKCSE